MHLFRSAVFLKGIGPFLEGVTALLSADTVGDGEIVIVLNRAFPASTSCAVKIGITIDVCHHHLGTGLGATSFDPSFDYILLVSKKSTRAPKKLRGENDREWLHSDPTTERVKLLGFEIEKEWNSYSQDIYSAEQVCLLYKEGMKDPCL
jgi:hypothetical protein